MYGSKVISIANELWSVWSSHKVLNFDQSWAAVESSSIDDCEVLLLCSSRLRKSDESKSRSADICGRMMVIMNRVFHS